MASIRESKDLKTKVFLWGVFGIVLVAVMAMGITIFDKGKSDKGGKRKTTEIMIAPTEADFASHEARYNDRLITLENEIKKMRAETQKAREESKSKNELIVKQDDRIKELERAMEEKKASESKAIGEVAANNGWPPAEELLGKGVPSPRKGFGSGNGGAPMALKTSNSQPAKAAPTMVIFEVTPSKKEQKQVVTYLPSGTFAKARLLNGATASTRGQGSGNPVPVLLELTDSAIMPNLYKAGIQKCFVTGHATGELASERVLIRTDRLSCIDGEGGAVDKKIQGYVAGEDGKTGLSARLVTKSGQAIANALMTGTLSGLGKAVSIASENQTTSITGTVTTTVTNPWRAGFGEGASHAMDRITDYYLKLATDMFPVLEVDSGRQVEVVLSQGVSIERSTNPEKENSNRSRNR